MNNKLFLMLAFLASPIALAENLTGRADINYSEANPDYSPYSNGEGVSFFTHLTYDKSWIGYYRYSDSEFRPSGPVVGENVELWQELGFGYRYELGSMWAFEGAVSYQEVDQENSDDSGYEVQIGTEYRPFESITLGLHVGYLDVQIDDWNLDFETRYYFMDRFYAVAKLRDYADWDFTYYEGGIGITF